MKLLHHTRRPIWIYATVVLLLSIPAYYLVLRTVWLADIDEDLVVIKHKVQRGIHAGQPSEEALAEAIRWINAIEAGVQLRALPPDSVVEERFHTVERYDDLHGHEEPFRTYESMIVLNGSPYAITVTRVIEETEDLVTAIAIVALVSLVLLLGGVMVFDHVTARRIWAPFHRLLDALKRFQVDGPMPFKATPTGVTEFDELERVVEQLTQRNRTIYAEQQRFTENAAHELRTPIALLQGKVESLFQTSDLTTEQAGLLDEANRLLGRMRRTHDGLLMLAHVDNMPVRPDVTCDPRAIVRSLLDHTQEHIASLGLSVSFEMGLPVQWPMEPGMAEILLGNLVNNAIRHSVPGGSIRIRLSGTLFTIANNGTDKPLDPESLFKRFSGSGKGLGLGLAIAQRVCERQGWSLRYVFEGGMHGFSVQPSTAG
ncbi:MAG TPA: HAMP domain-containing sensor histidine kinase [Flavobacteriales bacterium]|nr:HAMP domain-containing sensor histidine kinase [Flavobacteriales bacterium]